MKPAPPLTQRWHKQNAKRSLPLGWCLLKFTDYSAADHHRYGAKQQIIDELNEKHGDFMLIICL